MPERDRSSQRPSLAGVTAPQGRHSPEVLDPSGALREHAQTVARLRRSGGFSGWQAVAMRHRYRLQDWAVRRRNNVHERAIGHGTGAACLCGLVVGEDPVETGEWSYFFDTQGHLNMMTGEPATLFLATGGSLLRRLWCSRCGEIPASPQPLPQDLDDEVLEILADVHATRCRGR